MKKNWQLMSIEDLVEMWFSNNVSFRTKRSYYKSKNNPTMLARFEEANKLGKERKVRHERAISFGGA